MAISARIEELERKFNENPRRYFAPLANEYRKAGDVAHAIELCRAYLPQQPGHMSGHIVFGQALFESRALDEAQGVFQTALTLDPENLIALRHLGDIARERGEIAEARTWYQRVLDADPRNEEIAEQLQTLAAMPEDAVTTAEVPPAAGTLGWGDIHPEKKEEGASAADVMPAASPSAELDSLHVELEAVAPREGAMGLVERSEEVDTSSLTPPAASVAAGPPAPASDPAARNAPQPTVPAELPTPAQAEAPPPARTDEERPKEPVRAAPPPAAQSGFSTAAPTSEIGLESMEFTPPAPSEHAAAAVGLETGHEAVVGGPVTHASPPRESSAGPPAFVTETMAELYLQQGFTQEALGVYRQLLAQNPDDESLRERIAQLERGARSSVSAAAISDNVIEEAQRRAATPRRRTMRAFLGVLASRRAPRVDARVESSAAAADAGNGWVAHGASGSTDGSVARSSRAEERGVEDTLDALFRGAEVAGEDERAAATLAGAFPASDSATEASIPGRPTHEAATELSLDHVFRENNSRGTGSRGRSDFSFDQFFSENAGDDVAGGPASTNAPAMDEPPSADDIEQFNSWLEALKKK